MREPIAVHFQEFERYDITKDADVLMFMATTAKGCYHAEITKDGFMQVRDKRKAFREKAADVISAGRDPCEIEL